MIASYLRLRESNILFRKGKIKKVVGMDYRLYWRECD